MKSLIIASTLIGSMAMASEADLAKSEVKWAAKKVVAGGHGGQVKIKSVSLQEEKGELKGGEVTIDLKSIEVGDLEGEWREKFLGHIKSADFFDVEKYPEATLKIQSLKGDEATGTLTIKNKTNPISIKFTKKEKTYEGSVVFDRTKYDMIYGSNSFFKNLGDKAIAHDVKIDFKLVLK